MPILVAEDRVMDPRRVVAEAMKVEVEAKVAEAIEVRAAEAIEAVAEAEVGVVPAGARGTTVVTNAAKQAILDAIAKFAVGDKKKNAVEVVEVRGRKIF